MTARETNEKCSEKKEYIVVGKVQGHFGIKGWLKILSFTRPPLEILEYREWSFVLGREFGKDKRQSARQTSLDQVDSCDETLHLLEGKWQGKGLIVRLESINSREEAERLIGATVVVDSEQFARLDDGEFYWSDLIGLRVKNIEGLTLGIVDHLVETGANDVMIIHKEIEGDQGKVVETLVPWSDTYVRSVSLESGVILVDWDAD